MLSNRLGCLVMAALVYVNYRTPTPDSVVGYLGAEPLEAFSYNLLAPDNEIVRPLTRRNALLGMTPEDRRRCWTLFRIIIAVFRQAPERRASLERVVHAFASDLDPSRAAASECEVQ